MKTVRCTLCRAEFTDAEIDGFSSCPSCGHPGVPMAIRQDVTVRINWHELRILAIWAMNHAGAYAEVEPSMRNVVGAIVRELERQRPEGFAALSIAGEVREMQLAGLQAELRDAAGNVIVPKPEEV